MKTQPTEWGKIFASDATDKGLISKNIQIVPTTQNEKKLTTQTKNGQKI